MSNMKKSAEIQERRPSIYVNETGEKVLMDKELERFLQEKAANAWMQQAKNAADAEIFGGKSQKNEIKKE